LPIPKQSAAGTAAWVAEGAAITPADQTFSEITMSSKTCASMTEFSRRLLLQSSVDVESLISQDLAKVVGLAVDLAAINGSGASNQPTGILKTTGIGDVAGGTNGLQPTFANIVDLESDVAAANADVDGMAYLTSPEIRGTLKQTEKATNTAQFVWDKDGTNGYRAFVSNQVPKTLTKGTSSNGHAIIFGNFHDLIIGQWGGGIDLLVDPYTKAETAQIRVRVLADIDIAIRHAESFSAMRDALI